MFLLYFYNLKNELVYFKDQLVFSDPTSSVLHCKVGGLKLQKLNLSQFM